MKRAIICLLAAAWAGLATRGAATTFSKAETLSGTKTVTLSSDADGNYCAFLKFTAKKSTARSSGYTVYTTGSGAVDMDISYIKDWQEKDYDNPIPWFSTETAPDNLNVIAWTDPDDWDDSWAETSSERIPSDVTYIICITGDGSIPVTVNLVNKIVPYPTVWGTEEDPRPITPASGNPRVDGPYAFISGEYHFIATLTAGVSYKFGTVGGAEENGSYSISFTAEGEGLEDLTPIPLAEWTDDYNEGYVVKPRMTGTYRIVVNGEDNFRFSLRYCQVPARTPAQHTQAVPLSVTPAGVTKACSPCYRNNPGSGYVDDVIDDALFRLDNLVAGKYYAFWTSGACSNLVMEVYNSTESKYLLRNFGAGGTKDCRITFVPERDGTYYVGICLNGLNEDDPGLVVTPDACEFHAKQVEYGERFPGGLEKDVLDPADDDYRGATALDPKPGTKDQPAESGSVSERHQLMLTDFTDVFSITATKGLAYKLKAVLCCGDPLENAPVCRAEVFTVKNGAKIPYLTIEDAQNGGSFVAEDESTYYMSLSLTDGQGCDFGSYEIYSLMYDTQGRQLGKIKVEIGGALYSEGAAWYITAQDGTRYGPYPGDASKWLPVGKYTVSFATDVPNWTAPKSVEVTLAEGEGNEPVVARYSDLCDDPSDDKGRGDGSRTGAKVTTVVPGDGKTYSRSLWQEDAQDWFKFEVREGTYYTFSLAASPKRGDATFRVYRANGTDVVAEPNEQASQEGDRAVTFYAKETATYWVCVRHEDEDEPVHSQYVLSTAKLNVGIVRFDKPAYTVKDSAIEAVVSVVRTGGSEGAVSVRYTTEKGSAVPGTNYLATTGFLSWGDGDAAARKISVRLVPDLVARWAEDRSFSVRIAELEPAAIPAGERSPGIGDPDVTVVTLTDATRKSAGKVEFAGTGDAVPEPFANPLKPAVTVRGGENVRFWLSRTGGSDGEIAVIVTPAKISAEADVDFDAAPQTVRWAAGDTAPKPVVVRTFATDDGFRTPRTFTVRLTADRTSASHPTTGRAVTVTVTDPRMSESFAAYVSPYTASADGMTIRSSRPDGWYFDEAGLLRNAPLAAGERAEITISLTGPGRFTCEPQCDAGTLAYTLDGADASGARSHYVGKGSHSVRISVSGEDANLVFAAQDGNVPFLFKRLPAVGIVSPFMNEVIDKAKAHLYWEDLGDPEIVYLLRCDKAANRALLGTGNELFPATDYSGNPPYKPYRTGTNFCPFCGDARLEYDESYVWRVDSAFIDDEGTIRLVNTNAAVWAFRTAAYGTAAPACTGGMDASGRAIAVPPEMSAGGGYLAVTLVQGVAVPGYGLETKVGGGTVKSGVTYSAIPGCGLPAGLRIADGRIVGVPSKAGEFETAILASVNGTSGSCVSFKFTVLPLGLAAGSFEGLVSTDDSTTLAADDLMNFGLAKVSVTEAGKISASVKLGRTTYRFSQTGYDGWAELLDSGFPGVTGVLTKAETRLELVACRASTDDVLARDVPMDIRITVPVSDGKGGIRTVVASGRACRDNLKLEGEAERLSGWSGYYTIALPPAAPAVEGFEGSGYLLASVNGKGRARLTAALADGSTFTASADGHCLIANEEEGVEEYFFPVHNLKLKRLFGGWLRFRRLDDGTPVVRSDSGLVLICSDANATREGKNGYGLSLEPTGGWYDTVMNLQRYYLDWDTSADVSDGDALLREIAGGRDIVVGPGYFGDGDFEIIGKKFVADADSASGLKITFSRAKGTYTANFNLAAGTIGDPVKIGAFKAKGVLILTRDDRAVALPEDGGVIGPGYFNANVNLNPRTWKVSLPFALKAVYAPVDNTEGLPKGGNF